MPALPSSLTAILSLLRPAFTAPTFQVFEALLAGLVSRVGEHTVTGMWQAARLAGKLHHSRGHDFFARAAWCPDRLGLLLLDFLLERFTDPEAPISLAVDGTVFGRAGRKVFGASWHHDSQAPWAAASSSATASSSSGWWCGSRPSASAPGVCRCCFGSGCPPRSQPRSTPTRSAGPPNPTSRLSSWG